MKTTLLKLFARPSANGKSPAVPKNPKDNPVSIQEGSENGVRRHLVQVLLRDLLRRHGIPAHWIDCQMMVVSSRTKGSGMYIRLVVQHWDERLMKYAFAIQKELIAEIKQSEPQAANWLHGISWQLEVEGSYPYTTLPGKSFWVESKTGATPEARPIPAPKSQSAQPQPQTERLAEAVNTVELEKLFAIRDRELSVQTDHGVGAAGYEKTQPGPL